MEFYIFLLLLLRIKATNIDEFPNLTRGFFKYNDLVVEQDDTECSLCSFELWPSVSKIYKISDQNDFQLAVSKQETIKKVQACQNCLLKLKIFKEIEGKMQNCSLIATQVENLNYLESLHDGNNCFMVAVVDQSYFMVAVNNNTVNSVENVVFLVPVEQDVNNPLEFSLVNSEDTQSLLTKKFKNIALEYIETGNFKKGNLKVSAALLKELANGKSLFTAHNAIVAIFVYYVVGFASVLLYFNFNKKDADS